MTLRIDPPNSKPQKAFFQARARFVAYGGARGGGKSWAVRTKAVLMALRYAGIRILFLRRTYPELRENHIVQLKAMLEGVATWRELEKAFSFPNGSRIIFGHCAGEHDVDQFQGQEYDVICIDEATQFTEYQFSVLTACLRGGNPFPKRMYLPCNPGGVGHMWVKRLFVDREYKPGENPEDYVFILALASDNPVWKKNDPKFLEGLDNLPDGLREAWRDGRWDIFAGQYFPEFRRETHVIPPRTLPDAWPRYRVIDYGLDMLACYWAAIDYDGRIWIYRELCSPNLIVSQAAEAMRERTPAAETIRYTLAPPDLWSTQKVSGRTMAEEFIRCGVSLVRAPNQRVHGWLALKEYLKLWTDGRPGMLIFEDCKRLIRDLAAVQHDEKNPSDVAKEPHEYTHSVDSIRYLCAFRAMGAEPEEPERDDDDEGLDYDEAMLGGALSEEYLTYGG